MQITPKFGPEGPASLPTAKAEQEMSPRDRAISKLIGGNPVPNATQVAPEEVSALTSAVENPTVETPAENAAPSEPAEAKEETSPLSSQYAVLARKEKALRQQMAKFQAEQRAFKEQQGKPAAPVNPAEQELAALKAKIANDPLGLMSESGHTWDDLTQKALNQPSPNEQALQRKIAQMEQKLAQFDEYREKSQREFEESQTNAYRTAITQLQTETKMLVDHDAEYEAIKAQGRYGDVVELIEETFKHGFPEQGYRKGTVMPVEVAARLVEDHLVEEAVRVARLAKIQKRLATAPAAPATKQPATPQQPQLKTLTNAVGTTRKLTSRERAILAFEGKLNKSQ